MRQRIISLVDCDSFFVSCELVDAPELRGQPVCVTTGAGSRGIIVSRSPEAKKIGIKMGEPLFQVEARGLKAVCLPARHERYEELSAQVMEVLYDFSPDVEQVSVDEAFVDLTSLNRLYNKSYTEIIIEIRKKIWQQVEIPVSIGLATSKTLAKLASDKAKKNNGIFILPPDRIMERIGNISIDEVSGIGKQHQKYLHFLGIFTIEDFIKKPDVILRKAMGINGLNLKYELQGICTSLVNTCPQAPKSIQDTAVLGVFTTDKSILRAALLEHIQRACRKLRRWNGFCGIAQVMLRTKDFKVITRHKKLDFYTNSEGEIAKTALNMLDDMFNHFDIYRSTGIGLEDISYSQQPSLFAETPLCHDSKLSHAIDELEEKFGKNIVKTGWI